MNASHVLMSILAVVAVPTEVRLRPVEGEPRAVRMVELSASQAVVQVAGQPQTVPVADILWLDFPAGNVDHQPTAWIELLDGSRLFATEFTSKEGKAQVALTSGQRITMPTRSIRVVRFAAPSPELAGAWREILESRPAGDLVVVPRETTRQIEDGENDPMVVREASLDQLEGTILDVGTETVQFSVGGNEVPARRAKLAGIVYYQAARRQFSAPLCKLIDVGGSAWALRDVKLKDDTLLATAVGGTQFSMPVAAVAKVDFSVGNLQFLADLEPDSGGEPEVSLQPANMELSFSDVFQVRAGPPLGADAFRIHSRQYESGLSLHSPLTLVYRVPEGFRRLRAIAGIDDSLLAPGTFDLLILGDGKELLRQRFGAEQFRGPLPIDLDVAGVRRISIILDPADGQDIGDQLNLCEARFTK